MRFALCSPAPTDARSEEILLRLRSAFAEKGFDGASMQDLARAAGMSVGNFYRYFPSKSAIIAQMIQLDLAHIQGQFSGALSAPRPLAALRALIHARLTAPELATDGQLWAEIAAAARRSSDIAAAACAMEAEVTSALTSVFAAETGLALDTARSRFATEATFIVLLFRSAAMIPPQESAQKSDLIAMILRFIDTVLDEISAQGLKG